MTHFLRIRGLIGLLVLVLMVGACTSFPSGAVPTSAETTQEVKPTATETAPASPTALPTSTSNPDPLASCPTPGKDASLYISKENGYCLLIPAPFHIQPDVQRPDEVLYLQGPAEADKPKLQEKASVWLSISYNGPADGLDSVGYARKWFEIYVPDPGAPYLEERATIGGQPATILKDLPGFIAQRSAFTVANGIKYQITQAPQPEDIPELADPANSVWDMVFRTIVFFPPQNQRVVIRPEEVCPQESSETHLLRSDLNGFCYLYPADFEIDNAIPGTVRGGPVLGQAEGFGDVRTFLTVGTFGFLPDQTPRQVLEPRLDAIDSTSIEDVTIGGYPAVTFRSFQGPWPSRQAIISVDGEIFTIVAEPWDPEKYPAGIPYLDKIWEMATQSLTFYSPWR